MTSEEMYALREAIKKKYEYYRLTNPAKYPNIKFNSYPTPYEHLQESMKEEFIKLGDKGRKAIATIPSTRIFAKIFHEGYILKDERLLDSCYLYAEEKIRVNVYDSKLELKADQPNNIVVTKTTFTKRLFIGIVIFSVLLIATMYFVNYRQVVVNTPSQLILRRPLNGQTVPMETIIEGSVTNADSVWPIVCDVRDTIYNAAAYYVQDRIPVYKKSNIWKGVVQIGGRNKQHIGANAIIRVFVNPKTPLREGERLYEWPLAELSSAGVHVIRGYFPSDFASDLTITLPINRQVVPMKVLIEGKVMNADIVWPVIHAMPNGGYYVQAPSRVEKNGKWRGPIYIGGLDQSSVGSHYQIRVFVNPSTTMKEGDEIRGWPEADLSSIPIEVVRGAKK